MWSPSTIGQAAERLDLTMLSSVLDDDVEFHAPALARLVFSGRNDVLCLFRTVFSMFDEVKCRTELADGSTTVLVLDCRFGRLVLTDALVVRFGDNGLVRSFEPHLRPWPSSSVFIVRVATRLCRHPRVLFRSLHRRPSSIPE